VKEDHLFCSKICLLYLFYYEGGHDVIGCITCNMGHGGMMFCDIAVYRNVVILQLFGV